jgi:hypothetical protein
MRINFFEECIDSPETDLANAKLISWPCTIYIAAHSIEEFKQRRQILFSINPKLQAAYWPILPNSYWISPFSDPEELTELRNQLIDYDGEPMQVLLDLELPILKPELFSKNRLHFFSNRRRIRQLLALQKENISFATAEYWYAIGWAKFLTRLAGISYKNTRTKHARLIMYYTSGIGENGVVTYAEAMNYMKVALTKEAARKKGVQAAIGTTSIGIFGNEKSLTLEQLDEDLRLLKSVGFEETTIFRLAGIAPYMGVIKKFVD